jgi:aspartate oxidase
MNLSEVTRIDRQGAIALLYSHDDGFTRHVVEIYPSGQYICRINEVPCFRRGTHDRMARLHGFELTQLEQRTKVPT